VKKLIFFLCVAIFVLSACGSGDNISGSTSDSGFSADAGNENVEPEATLAPAADPDPTTQPQPQATPAPVPEPDPTPEPELATNTFPFPFEFITEDLHGNQISAATLGEREIFFVYYWTTWCFACVEGIPGLASLAEEFGDRVGFITLLGDFSTASDIALQIVESAGANFPTVNAEHGEFQSLMALLSSGFVPTSVIIDGDGNVIDGQIIGSGTDMFRTAIENALGG